MENYNKSSYEEKNSQQKFENLEDTAKEEIETNINPDPSIVDTNEPTTKNNLDSLDKSEEKDFNEFESNYENSKQDKKRSNSKVSSGSKNKELNFSVSNPITKEGLKNFNTNFNSALKN